MADLDTIRDVISLPYAWSTGPAGARFLGGLKDKKILGTRCGQCQRTLVPGRTFCPRCFVNTPEWVEVADTGKLRTYTIINYTYEGQPRTPPYVVGIIDLDGADVGFTHFVGGVDLSDFTRARERLSPGLRVQAVWKEEREGRVLDIEHFVPMEPQHSCSSTRASATRSPPESPER